MHGTHYTQTVATFFILINMINDNKLIIYIIFRLLDIVNHIIGL